MTGARKVADQPWRLPIAILLGVGLAVTWTGAVLLDLELHPLAGPWPRAALPPLPDPGLLPAGEGALSAEALRRTLLHPMAAQLLFAVGLTVVLVIAQLIMTLWARAVARTHEMAVRRVLGPNRRQLLAPLLRAVAGMIGRGGVAAGIIAAVLVVGAWLSAPAGTRPLPGVSVSLAVAASILLIGTVLLFGLLPAAVTPTRALSALRSGGRVTARSGGGMVTVQVALAVALTYAGAVQLQGGHAAEPDAPETAAARTITARAVLAPVALAGTPNAAALLHGLRTRLGAGSGPAGLVTPGASVGVGPVRGFLTECPGCTMGGLATPLRSVDSVALHVTPGALAALGAEVVAGRDIGPADDDNVALVNQALIATGALGDGDVLGRTIRLGTDPRAAREIVGVVRDVPVADGLRAHARPTVYLPWPRATPAAVEIVVPSGPGEGDEAGERLATAVAGIPGLDLVHRSTIGDARSQGRLRTAWLGALVAVFGAIAFLVAGYGTTLATRAAVQRRRRELGIRLALGASPRRLVLAVAKQSAWHVVRGALLSGIIVIALGSGRWDPALFAAIVGLVGGLVLLGAVAPARAAAAVPPDASLRSE